jgi:soluble lytic murein transglycosylase-like protein
MITLRFVRVRALASVTAFWSVKRKNILRHFCFTLFLAGWAGTALPASGADQPQRYSSVVRPDQRTGKLVRSMVLVSRPVAEQKVPETVVRARIVTNAESAQEPQPPAAGIDEAVERIAAQHALPPQLLHSVIKVESNYNPYAISSKGAQGLMQLIPATARRFGVSDAFNPVENIQGGARYLKYLMDLYHGDYPLALAAYNAGEEAVARYGGVPPFPETRNYVVQVKKQLEISNQAAANAKPKETEVQPLPVEPDGPRHVQEIVEPDGRVRYVSR